MHATLDPAATGGLPSVLPWGPGLRRRRRPGNAAAAGGHPLRRGAGVRVGATRGVQRCPCVACVPCAHGWELPLCRLHSRLRKRRHKRRALPLCGLCAKCTAIEYPHSRMVTEGTGVKEIWHGKASSLVCYGGLRAVCPLLRTPRGRTACQALLAEHAPAPPGSPLLSARRPDRGRARLAGPSDASRRGRVTRPKCLAVATLAGPDPCQGSAGAPGGTVYTQRGLLESEGLCERRRRQGRSASQVQRHDGCGLPIAVQLAFPCIPALASSPARQQGRSTMLGLLEG